tara:strand:- start:1929 stop:3626 length:1698 start_codon:yes stop_codon:yes gene_type:complete
MAEKVTIEVEADVKEALQKLGEIEKGVKDVGVTAKKQNSAIKSLSNGFKGLGLAMKAAGIGIVLKVVDQLGQALMRNQETADAVATAFNMVGIVFNKIISTIKTVYDRVTATTENFDALGRLIKNLMTLALTPLKLTFNSVALVIKEVQLAWEKSWLGKGDVKRIQELTNQINGYKQEIKEAGEEAIAAGKGIIVDFREGIGEISKMGRVVVQEFNNTFKGVTIKTVKDQAEAVVKATNNLSLLEAKHEGIIKQFETDAEIQRKIRDDVSKSIQDRIKANDELLTISEKQAEAELEALKEQKSALATQLTLQKDNAEILAQIERLNNAITETEFRKTQLEKESGEQKNALLAEERANKEELAKIGVDEVKRQEQEFLNEKNRLLRMAELTINNEEELAKKKEQINIDYQKKKDKLDAEGTAKEEALQDQRRQIIGGALTGLTALVGAETKAGKGLAVAQATMDTYAGATKALAQGGLFGAIGAAGVIAAGLANVRSILQTDIPGESGGGTAPNIDAGVSIEDTVPTVPTFGAIETEPPPVQAFVVESDVSSSQALQNDLNLQATL